MKPAPRRYCGAVVFHNIGRIRCRVDMEQAVGQIWPRDGMNRRQR